MNFLITGDGGLSNNGVMAMVMSFIEESKTYFKDSKYSILSGFYDKDRDLFNEDNIHVIDMVWNSSSIKDSKMRKIRMLFRIIKYTFLFILIRISKNKIIKKNDKLIESYMNADVIIDLSGDSLTDSYGDVSCLLQFYSIFLGVLLSKKIFLCAQTIGPFSKLSKLFSKFIFKRVRLVTTRDAVSEKYMIDNKLIDDNKIKLTKDVAFLLKPKEPREICSKEINFFLGRELFGINLSNLVIKNSFMGEKNKEREDSFYIALSDVINKVMEEFDLYLVLIPHVISEEDSDLVPLGKVYDYLKYKKRTAVVKDKYIASELKYIIGRFNYFLGCRMHSTIAAVSMGVPTIALSYSSKYRGVLSEIIGESNIIDPRYTNPMEFKKLLSGRVFSMIENGKSIKKSIEDKIDKIQEESRKNFVYLKEIINN